MPFVKGDKNINRKGRVPGSGLSLKTLLKNKMNECPEGSDKKTHAELMIDVMMLEAIKKRDYNTIKLIWEYLEGKPKQDIDYTNKVTISDKDRKKAEEAIKSYIDENKQNTRDTKK